jgi:branched-chain amino acid transport system permease protein
MDASLIVLALMDGVSYAAQLFVVALGLTLIFGVMRILNVAHGSLYAWGGYFAATLGLAIGKFALPAWLALPALFAAAIVIGGLLGTVLEFALLRRILEPWFEVSVATAAIVSLLNASPRGRFMTGGKSSPPQSCG